MTIQSNQVRISCSQCNLELWRPPSSLRRNKLQFCDLACRRSYSSSGLREYCCEKCGSQVFRTPAQVKGRVFCSSDCFNKKNTQTKEYTCGNCQKSVWRNPKARRKSKRTGLELGTFCSVECMVAISISLFKVGKESQNFKHGKYAYRKLALAAYGHKCQSRACPIAFEYSAAMLDVHHKDGDRKNNKIENLEVLCVWCHALESRRHLKHWGAKGQQCRVQSGSI